MNGEASRKPLYLPELYVLIDEGILLCEDSARTMEQAILGGADAIQFRAKKLSKRRYYAKAGNLQRIARTHRIPFFVNDHLDIAIAISADGVHLGQTDLPASAARRIMPDAMMLGISTHSLRQAEKAVEDGADYVAIGPVFPTTTKDNAEPVVGTDAVRLVKSRTADIPVLAIGGITSQNAAEVIRSGADGIAVASAVLLADQPLLAVKDLKERIQKAKRTR